jgi:prepilin-type N-terminal cleavage/methylation domain-containing protein/prepilin-type processing-associated H-X9-DG protein
MRRLSRFTSPQPPQRGFTLVELLVVIAIIGVLVALLLPAIQAAREAARRSQCQNNLKQVGLAVQLHHNAKRFFPTARNAGDARSLSWAYYCLPFMEQTAMFQAYRKDLNGYELGNSVTFRTPVPTLYCTSRRAPAADRDFDGSDPNVTVPPEARGVAAGGDYAANAGTLFRGANMARLDESGPIFTQSKINEKQVTDGLSNSFAVGEKYIGVTDPNNPPADGMECAALGDCAIFDGNNPETVMRSADKGFPSGQGYGASDNERFGSAHTDLANFAYLDGSVRPINYSINQIVYENLGNIADDNPIGEY